MTIDEARAVAGRYVDELSRELSMELVIVEVAEKEPGWVFFYNTRAFAESRDPLMSLVGNAPLLVRKKDGSLVVLGTGRPVDDYIADMEW